MYALGLALYWQRFSLTFERNPAEVERLARMRLNSQRVTILCIGCLRSHSPRLGAQRFR